MRNPTYFFINAPDPQCACRQDAWPSLHPGQAGYTYDGKANAMLGNSFRSRLDRVLLCLQGWKVSSVKV